VRTALLLPGHMRAYKRAFENQYKNIIEPLNCDIFISTSIANTIVDGNIIKVEKITKEKLEEEIRYHYSHLLKDLIIEEESDEDIHESIKDWRPWRGKQWMRLQQCNNMRKKFEKQNDFKYDAVIRSRTDLIFNKKLTADKKTLTNGIFLMKHSNLNHAPIHDQFAIGKPEYMDIYCELYDHFVTRENGGASEVQLYNWLSSQKIQMIDMSQIIQFKMLRRK